MPVLPADKSEAKMKKWTSLTVNGTKQTKVTQACIGITKSRYPSRTKITGLVSTVFTLSSVLDLLF